ncbi:MAG: helix-turn-helix domain-containing protein [Bacillota bacterium]|jgi:AraC-like DNA-binding protein/mannose-6-phosphate isomerase-like protein (cupin superfamily)|nr:helix-turn-helix domain-containing protein [Bacillota bacterium]NLL25960.1 AraC family transcriptional regulator [Erysipelotrichia bacterium]
MLNKTTSANFLKFGKVNENFNKDFLSFESFVTDIRQINFLKSYNQEVYICINKGMGMLVISDDPELNPPQFFAIHRDIEINPNMYFAVVPMTNVICYDVFYNAASKVENYKLLDPVNYENITLKTKVDKIIAYYYAVKGPNYVFPGETHYLYEFTYVDNGTLEVTVNDKKYTVNSNQCLFYGPGQSHSQRVYGNESCSYLTVIFEASGIEEDKLLNRVFSVTREIKTIIDDFVRNSNESNLYSKDLQIVSLNTILLKILQHNTLDFHHKEINIPVNQNYQNNFLEEIIAYIHNNIYKPLTVADICHEFSISRTYLQRIFNETLHVTPKKYIIETKLAKSKILIKNGNHSLSEIADKLGYSSIHYFSRIFTSNFGITPSEYSKKIY